ncbi:outer membrane beta-barrel protein [Ferruginibacter sp. SUN002]|uniref:outer membrane beta-barrel protein n=1 Tax=Ferruginibacter sp. SUN002 TaxID=2937789 RepID=UPI003D367449
MKKVILSLAIVALATASANAQTEKGTWLLGGSASFASEKQKPADAVTRVNISPAIGYFVAQDIAVGAGIDLSSVKDSYTQFGFAPFARYYFLPIGTNAKLFVNGKFGFGSWKPKTGDSESFTNWELSAGPAFFLNKSIALEVALAYGSEKWKSDSDPTNSFGLKAGFQIHLGKK